MVDCDLGAGSDRPPSADARATASRPAPAGADEDWSGLMELVARKRDREAFATLFRHFAPRLKSYMLRLGAHDGRAEELVQETMLTAWRRAPQYDQTKAAVSTWLFTIARNKRIDGIRRERRPEPDPEDPAFAPQAPPPADEVLELADMSRHVRAAMADLPPEQAQLIHLSFFADKPHSEIAAELDLPLGTVKSRIRLAMQKLRTAFEVEA